VVVLLLTGLVYIDLLQLTWKVRVVLVFGV
jgi:hypothetical protein